jgi:hypothetical protein
MNFLAAFRGFWMFLLAKNHVGKPDLCYKSILETYFLNIERFQKAANKSYLNPPIY